MKKIFLGPPGSGKGTAASKVAPHFKIPHISTGDLFRQNIQNKTEIGIKAKEFINQGKLVPDEIVLEMLKKRISKEDCKNGFILDGFPRTIPQAENLQKLTKIDIVINIDVPEEIVIKRLCSRVTCINCGEIYNLNDCPPKQENVCDKCNAEVKHRDDEKPEVIQDRLKIYREQTTPLIDFYKNQNILRTISCSTIEQTREETLQKILEVIEEFIAEKEN